MMKVAKAAGVAGILIAALAAAGSSSRATQSNTAPEGHAVITQLSPDISAISYWVSTPDGWDVVTTVDTVSGRDSDAERHAIVRFSATLSPGQEQVISVPAAVGEPQQALRIRRNEDGIEVARVTGS